VKRPRIDLQSPCTPTRVRTQPQRFEIGPEELLESIHALLLYLPEGGERLALAKRGLGWARKLLNVKYRSNSAGLSKWRLQCDWRERLELFGIDPDTLKVVDQERFALVWSDLKRGEPISKHRQRLRIARLEESEPAAPLVEFQG
jgi:hypothetical protein